MLSQAVEGEEEEDVQRPKILNLALVP